jgi:hypothetical protein
MVGKRVQNGLTVRSVRRNGQRRVAGGPRRRPKAVGQVILFNWFPKIIEPQQKGDRTSRAFGWRCLVPGSLLGLAGALALVAYSLLPGRAQNPTVLPPAIYLSASANDTIGLIEYSVTPSRSVQRWTVTLSLEDDVDTDALASVLLTLPAGASFDGCPRLECVNNSHGYSEYHGLFNLKRQKLSTATLHVAAEHFGLTTNGINASVGLPELMYTSAGQPSYYVTQTLGNANKYDWSALPVSNVSAHSATWLELANSAPIAGGTLEEVASRTATGVNHEQQDRDNQVTFVAGALVGAAGGAFVASIQESLPLGLELIVRGKAYQGRRREESAI